MTRARAAIAAGALLLSLPGPPAHALDPAKAISQYAHRAWFSRDGLPQNSVQALAQTRDGFIWVGTQEGLARFDGVAFRTYNRATAPQLPSPYVNALLEDRGGTLWVGTAGGLARMRDGAVTAYGRADGLAHETVLALAEDEAGRLWIGTARGVTVLEGGTFRAFAPDSPLARERITSVRADGAGSVWFGTYRSGAWRSQGGELTALGRREGLSHDTVWSIYVDRRGVVWIGTLGGGLNRLEEGRLRHFGARELGSDNVFGALEDRDGNLWFSTDGAGIARLAGGRFTRFGQAQGLSNDTAWPLLESREGILWVGTLNGVNQLRDAPFTPFGPREGLPEEVVLTVAQDRSGALWFGGNSRGASRLAHGRLTTYRKADGLAHDTVRALHAGGGGALWLGTFSGLSRLRGGRFESFTASDGMTSDKISALHEDADGALWIATFGGGLNRLERGRFTALTTRDGLVNDRIVTLLPRAAGGLWLGTEGGLSLFQDGRFTNYTRQDGLPHDHVQSLHEDADGTLWIGTLGGGLGRLRDSRFRTFTMRDGLFDDLAHQILEDDSGHLWLGSNRGIFRVSKRSLDEVAAGTRERVRGAVFDEGDGLRSSETNGSSQPAGIRAADGRLWFPTMHGAASVDPSRLPPEPAPPPAFLDRASAGGSALRAEAGVPPGQRSLEFHYTALEYHRPDRLRFRYRLEGFDGDWVDADARRAAYYTNIPPGHYRFLVAARSAGGPWSEAPASIAFTLEPRLIETAGFRGAAVLAALAALVAAHRLLGRHRERVARARTKDLEQRVATRTAELQEANRRLEVANRELEAFGHSVSHDLRAPLRTIDGFSVALAEDYGDRLDAGGHELLGRIRAATQRMASLIDDLLRLSRVTRAAMDPRRVDLTALAQAIAQSLDFESPGREVRCEIEAGLAAQADRGLLDVALRNLMANAWKFTAGNPHARVRVGARRADGRLAFFVADNGVGFDMARAGELFGAFRRLHAESQFPGNGIGLAIVERIVHRHGGTAWAEAKPGEGATFFFTLGDAGVATTDSPREA